MPIKKENKSLYPKNWKEIREAILQRANNKCEFCGIENHKWARSVIQNNHRGTYYRVVLTIAHLDHNPQNCNPNNLRALCQKCHNRYDAEHRRKNRSHTLALKKDKSLFLQFKD